MLLKFFGSAKQFLAKIPARLSGFLSLCGNILVGWLIYRATSLSVVGWSIVVGIAIDTLLIATYRTSTLVSRWLHWWALVTCRVGLVGLLLIIDISSSFGEPLFSWRLVWLLATVIPAISFFVLPKARSELLFMVRPHMRVCVGLFIVSYGALVAGLSAMMTFNLFPVAWWAWLILVGVVWGAVGALIAWRPYLADVSWFLLIKGLSLMVWILLQTMVMVSVWPIGFLYVGLLVAWIWYVVWLTVRYAFSESGLSWPRHGYFLALHGFFMALVLALSIRWR